MDKPSNVLIINGMWESTLRAKAVDIMNSIGIADPKEDLVYGSFDIGSARKISSIKNADHIGILYSIKTQKIVNNWINQITGENFEISTNYIGI